MTMFVKGMNFGFLMLLFCFSYCPKGLTMLEYWETCYSWWWIDYMVTFSYCVILMINCSWVVWSTFLVAVFIWWTWYYLWCFVSVSLKALYVKWSENEYKGCIVFCEVEFHIWFWLCLSEVYDFVKHVMWVNWWM